MKGRRKEKSSSNIKDMPHPRVDGRAHHAARHHVRLVGSKIEDNREVLRIYVTDTNAECEVITHPAINCSSKILPCASL